MNRRKGFTLIELLVVIAIIALLMSILMPALSRVKKQAQAVACMSRLKSWGMLFKLYTDDNNGFFNEGWGWSQHTGNAGSDELGLWMNAMRPYYKDEWDMLLCPTATRMVEGDTDWGTYKAWYRDIANRYPGTNETATKRFVGSYSTNDWISYSPTGRGANRPPENFWKRRRTWSMRARCHSLRITHGMMPGLNIPMSRWQCRSITAGAIRGRPVR